MVFTLVLLVIRWVGHINRALEVVLTEQWTIEERSNLVVSVMRGDQRRWEALPLNEMALHREPLTSMCPDRSCLPLSPKRHPCRGRLALRSDGGVHAHKGLHPGVVPRLTGFIAALECLEGRIPSTVIRL